MKFRVEKRYPGIGAVRQTVDLEDADEMQELLGLLVRLARSRPRLVEMFRAKELSARDLLRAAREDRIGALLADERALAALWPAIAAAWTKRGRTGAKTLARYRVSAKKLETVLPGARVVLDLEAVDWERVAAEWAGSPSDWMHCYRMLSAFLTRHFGGKRVGRAHPFRLKVMDLLPRKVEPKRVPSLTPALFLRLVASTDDFVRPAYMTLALTGLRVGEYLALRREHLRPDTYEIEVPGTKTATSAAVLPIDPAAWPWIDRAVPCPLGYRRLWGRWKAACRAEGVGDLRLHDLRHCTGQWLTNARVPESMTQVYLRHADPAMTRRYTVQQLRQEPAAAIARALNIEATA